MEQIIHFIIAGGFVMYPLILLSFLAIAVIIERGIAYFQAGNVGKAFVAQVIELAKNGQTDQALRLCAEKPGPVADCLATVLRHRERPVAEIERHVEEAGLAHFIRLEKYLPLLDTATTIAPLLGLLGTIVGMVGTFNAISKATTRGSGTDAILAGVGEALYATATGLTIAIVCLVAYNFFAARLKTITEESEQGATRLLNTIADSGGR